MGQKEPNSQFFADFCWFSVLLGITAFWRRRFSQKTAGNRWFSQKNRRNPFVPFSLSLMVPRYPRQTFTLEMGCDVEACIFSTKKDDQDAFPKSCNALASVTGCIRFWLIHEDFGRCDQVDHLGVPAVRGNWLSSVPQLLRIDSKEGIWPRGTP